MSILLPTADSATIAMLNDRARSCFKGCHIQITQAISALEPLVYSEVISAVQSFSCFDTGNDPYGEHDFGKISVAGHEVFWKFDYYDLDLQMASLDPANPDITARVLTIMLAEEY